MEKLKGQVYYSPQYEQEIYSKVANMLHRDIQRECILRGITFKELHDLSHQNLIAWFYANYNEAIDEKRLKVYDDLMKAHLLEKGYKLNDPVFDNSFNFYQKYDDETDQEEVGDSENPIRDKEKPSPIEKPISKPKQETNTETGVRKGTKKDLTYSLAREGKNITETWQKVSEQYPEAKESSVNIWFKRAIAAMREEKK